MKAPDLSPIVTQRLILRKFTPEDIDALLLIFGDEEANTFLPWFPIKTLDQRRRTIGRNRF